MQKQHFDEKELSESAGKRYLCFLDSSLQEREYNLSVTNLIVNSLKDLLFSLWSSVTGSYAYSSFIDNDIGGGAILGEGEGG